MLSSEDDDDLSKDLTDLSVLSRVQNFEQRVAVTCCGLLEFSQISSGYQRDWLVKIKPEISPVIRVGPRLLHQSVSEFLKEQDTMTGEIVTYPIPSTSIDMWFRFSY